MAHSPSNPNQSPVETYIQGGSAIAIVAAVTLLTGVSMWMNFIAGASFSTTAFHALLLGLLMVGTDTSKLFGLFFISGAYRSGKYIHCLLAAIMMMLCVGLSLFAGSKFAIDARLGAIAARADIGNDAAYDTAERDRLNEQLRNPSTRRSAAEIDAEIQGLLQRRFAGQTVANATQNCTDIGRIGQQTCRRIAELRQERAAAARYAELRSKRDQLNAAARAARKAAPKRDMQAEQYGREWGIPPETVIYYITWLLAIAAEYASIFFIYFVRTYVPLFRRPDGHDDSDNGLLSGSGQGLTGAMGGHGLNAISCGNPNCPHEHDQVPAATQSTRPSRRNGFDRHF